MPERSIYILASAAKATMVSFALAMTVAACAEVAPTRPEFTRVDDPSQYDRATRDAISRTGASIGFDPFDPRNGQIDVLTDGDGCLQLALTINIESHLTPVTATDGTPVCPAAPAET